MNNWMRFRAIASSAATAVCTIAPKGSESWEEIESRAKETTGSLSLPL